MKGLAPQYLAACVVVTPAKNGNDNNGGSRRSQALEKEPAFNRQHGKEPTDDILRGGGGVEASARHASEPCSSSPFSAGRPPNLANEARDGGKHEQERCSHNSSKNDGRALQALAAGLHLPLTAHAGSVEPRCCEAGKNSHAAAPEARL